MFVHACFNGDVLIVSFVDYRSTNLQGLRTLRLPRWTRSLISLSLLAHGTVSIDAISVTEWCGSLISVLSLLIVLVCTVHRHSSRAAVYSQYLPSPVGGKRDSIAPSNSWWAVSIKAFKLLDDGSLISLSLLALYSIKRLFKLPIFFLLSLWGSPFVFYNIIPVLGQNYTRLICIPMCKTRWTYANQQSWTHIRQNIENYPLLIHTVPTLTVTVERTTTLC